MWDGGWRRRDHLCRVRERGPHRRPHRQGCQLANPRPAFRSLRPVGQVTIRSFSVETKHGQFISKGILPLLSARSIPNSPTVQTPFLSAQIARSGSSFGVGAQPTIRRQGKMANHGGQPLRRPATTSTKNSLFLFASPSFKQSDHRP
jgi:hypothetical protein